MKSINRLRKNQGAYGIGILLVLFCFACGPSEDSDQETNKVAPVAVAGADGLKGIAEFPVSKVSKEYMKNYFKYAYKDGSNSNPATPDIKITLADFLTHIDTSFDSSDGIGIGIYYVIYSDNGTTTPYFTYAISCAQQNDIGIWTSTGLKSLGNSDKYLLLKKDSTVLPIATLEFNSLQTNYKNMVQNKSFTCPSTSDSVKNLPKHPLACYHKIKGFSYFISQNLSDSSSSSWKMRFDHGAIHINIDTLGNNKKYWVQTPLVYFEDDFGDPQVVSQLNLDQPYKKMALDLGHLCPPNCKGD